MASSRWASPIRAESKSTSRFISSICAFKAVRDSLNSRFCRGRLRAELPDECDRPAMINPSPRKTSPRSVTTRAWASRARIKRRAAARSRTTSVWPRIRSTAGRSSAGAFTNSDANPKTASSAGLENAWRSGPSRGSKAARPASSASRSCRACSTSSVSSRMASSVSPSAAVRAVSSSAGTSREALKAPRAPRSRIWRAASRR